jgi:hypothetical protein
MGTKLAIESMTREELVEYIKKLTISVANNTTEETSPFFKSVAKYTYIFIICVNVVAFALHCAMIITGMLKYEKKVGNMLLKSDPIFRLGLHTIEYFRSQRSVFAVKVPPWKTFIKTNQYKGYTDGCGIEQSNILRTHITYSKIVGIIGTLYVTGLTSIGMGVLGLWNEIPTNSLRQNARGFFAIILFNAIAFAASFVTYWMMVKELVWWDILTTIPIRMPTELIFKAHRGTKIITMEGLVARKELTDDYDVDGMGTRNKAFSVDFFENARDTKDLDKPDQFMQTTVVAVALVVVIMANVLTCCDQTCKPHNQVTLNATYAATLATAIQTIAYALTMWRNTMRLTKASRIYYDVFTKHQYVPRIQVGTTFYSVNYALLTHIFQPTILEVWVYFVLKTRGDITCASKKYTDIENNLRASVDKLHDLQARFGELSYAIASRYANPYNESGSRGFTREELTVMSHEATAIIDEDTGIPYFWNDDGIEAQLHDVACATALQCVCTIRKLSSRHDIWKTVVLMSCDDIERITGVPRPRYKNESKTINKIEADEERWWGMLKLVFAADIASRIVKGLDEYKENIAEVRRVILDTTELRPIIEWWDAPLSFDPDDYKLSGNDTSIEDVLGQHNGPRRLSANVINNVRRSCKKPMYKVMKAMFKRATSCHSEADHTKIGVGHVNDIFGYDKPSEDVALLVE